MPAKASPPSRSPGFSRAFPRRCGFVTSGLIYTLPSILLSSGAVGRCRRLELLPVLLALDHQFHWRWRGAIDAPGGVRRDTEPPVVLANLQPEFRCLGTRDGAIVISVPSTRPRVGSQARPHRPATPAGPGAKPPDDEAAMPNCAAGGRRTHQRTALTRTTNTAERSGSAFFAHEFGARLSRRNPLISPACGSLRCKFCPCRTAMRMYLLARTTNTAGAHDDQ